MAKYPYIVNKNGKWYPAGIEVPEDTEKTEENKDELSEKENERKKSYSKTEIYRMPNAELQELAVAQGIEGTTEKTGSELKKLLVQHFGL